MLPVLMFGAIALSVLILRAGGPDLPFVLLGAVLVLALAWILISSLNPARADRTCPECGEEALERLDPATTRGVVCSRCGHTDRDVSSWYLAEEETTLEEIVLAERGRVSGLEPEELARPTDSSPNTEITE
jgi:ribosomal protein L37AE/L43A